MTVEHKQGIYAKYIKRFFGFLCSLLFLILFCWLYAILAILVKTKLGSPVLFKQERPGKNEKIFKLYKFRTMTDERDENGNLLSDEVRLTKFGSFLRSTSLDGLPELINILKGDMAFVGPRPLLVSYLPYYTEEEQLRHTVRPGLTGWAQVNGRNFIGWDNRLKKDVEYSRKVSFLFDVKILFMTFVQVVKRDNISVDTHVVEPNFAEERKQKMERLKKVDVV